MPRTVEPRFARTWLLVPATAPDRFDAALASRTDAVVLDLEDAVDPSRKGSAREDVLRWLRDSGQGWVRINDRTSPFWAEDVAGLRDAPGLTGVMLAKTEAGEQVEETAAALGGSTPVVALVESALGIEDARDIATARGVFRLAFGSGDYRRDTGASADALAMAYPRSRLVTASRIGGLPGPVDGPTVGGGLPELREQSAVAVSLGMTGKLCLDLAQAPVINEVMSPTGTDAAWARDVLRAFEESGGIVRDGSDLPRIGRARRITMLAEAFGVEPV
ncbi:citrate lyase subunit beta/citryl-CoA lyase [Kineococcus xinjiangensis]|uniref:Citrate lyase subunit beta/citryl-CoA lyase n=1 Tax=Kineococcus xinjiangensis TaxID=512762 RepID=A0A2S6IPF5_9ACTN|nr:CoA ester lyase [Kineococcus xinjiangensis]PPK96109.1 citrate lyase subunit beta/citryl-CoA lyase [Kineococcus xinjiangensis]